MCVVFRSNGYGHGWRRLDDGYDDMTHSGAFVTQPGRHIHVQTDIHVLDAVTMQLMV